MPIMSILFQICARHFIQSEQVGTMPASAVPSNNKDRERQENWKRGADCCYHPAMSEFFTHSATGHKLCVAATTKRALLCERWIVGVGAGMWLDCNTSIAKWRRGAREAGRGHFSSEASLLAIFMEVTQLKTTEEWLTCSTRYVLIWPKCSV